MEEFMLILCDVLFICLERTQWISNGYGYPSDLDMDTIFHPWIFHGQAKIVFMDMDMDLRLFNRIQTRPITILSGSAMLGIHTRRF